MNFKILVFLSFAATATLASEQFLQEEALRFLADTYPGSTSANQTNACTSAAVDTVCGEDACCGTISRTNIAGVTGNQTLKMCMPVLLNGVTFTNATGTVYNMWCSTDTNSYAWYFTQMKAYTPCDSNSKCNTTGTCCMT